MTAGDSTADPENSRRALAQLCETYWPPLYTYALAQGHSLHDAQDLTQGFFAYLIERKIYQRAERPRGKFRSFLLVAFKNFLCDAHDREIALKRGGTRDFVPFDERKAATATSLFASRHPTGADALDQDRLFERSWAETLVSSALERVATAYKAEAKETLFEQLKNFLTVSATPLPTYTELAERLGLAESTVRSQVSRLRARYRALLREEVRRTVTTDAEVDGELRELLRVLSAA